MNSNRITHRHIVTRCYPNTQIFARFPSKSNITIEDAEQAYLICKNVPEEIKDDCYLTFGVDRRKTEQYLQTVRKLEETYHKFQILDVIDKIVDYIKYHVNLIVTLIKMILA